MGVIRPPEPLGQQHDVSAFASGSPEIDAWLRTRAARNQQAGATRTFVIVDAAGVVGFYALAAGAVAQADAPGPVRRNMPDPIPVVILARLGVDLRAQGRGLGAALVRDALIRSSAIAGEIGVRAVLIHAKHPGLGAFYTGLGFRPSPVDPVQYFVTVDEIRRAMPAISR
jgi:GNAT superfamily N-acetyltransferase